jgi:membrane protease YdiL (CAAX protease family)
MIVSEGESLNTNANHSIRRSSHIVGAVVLNMKNNEQKMNAKNALMAILTVAIVQISFFKLYDIATDLVLPGISDINLRNTVSFSMVLVMQLCVGFVSLLMMRKSSLGLSLEIGNPGNLERLKRIAWIIAMACGAAIMQGALNDVLSKIAPLATGAMSPNEQKKAEMITYVPSLLNWMIMVAIGPATEEIMYRGFLAQRLRRDLSLNVAIIISSVIFSLSHWDLDMQSLRPFLIHDFVPILFVGSLYTVVFFRYGIIAAIGMHAVHNSIALLVSHESLLKAISIAAFLGIFLIISMVITHFKKGISHEN